MKKIVITTTFRDFQGNINDRLQLLFLKSLKEQQYQNFVLLVTIFREKQVEDTVKKIMGDKVEFAYSNIPKNHRYSLSSVVLNGLEYGIKNGCDILVDCSGDVILQNNFLQVIEEKFSPMYTGISHPNIFYDIDAQWNIINKRVGECDRGIDVRFFDIRLLNSLSVKRRLQKYVLYDWGGFEHLLFGICRESARRSINIFEESKVIKVENDRDAANENNGFIARSVLRNQIVLKRLAKNTHIKIENLLDLFYIHIHYKNTKHRLRNLYYFRKEWKKWLWKKWETIITDINMRFV